MYGLRKTKNIYRQEYLRKRQAISPDEKKEAEHKICSRFLSSVSYKYYDTILLYAAMPDEPDLSEIAEKALKAKKRVAYPRCVDGNREMIFRFINSLSDLSPGHYGIYEPDVSLPAYDPKDNSCAVCLIPGLVFDKDGYRIGYGGGYYDKFLSEFCGTTVGVAFSGFIIDCVPRGKYDLQADSIITDGGIYTVDKA